eukprot:11091398-Lingulodinium_polyedra.AAC.1
MLSVGSHRIASVTPFFVKKKNGRIRLVLGARGVNEFFGTPPKPDLGSAAAVAQLELPEGG